MSARRINRVLVANRGEIARRVFTTCRRLGVSTVAVHSVVDADALFVGDADRAVALIGKGPVESYLDGAAIIAAARAAGADAVHPGYGFLSENADFAQAVIDAGLTWIGPSPAAIAAMGSKTHARTRMEDAGVPVLPGVRLDEHDDEAVLAAAAKVGYPLLVKASAGGGGKGMRRVDQPEALLAGVAAARREAAGAFGDDTVFLERYAARSRHVEIQILGDAHGTVVSLHERDCSVQRRHQKVVEESPSPAVDATLRAQMGQAAVAAGTALGYVGAGTVEFLVVEDDPNNPAFYFLEVNTRLQVEHPVTELVAGLDLVELQLLVADGHALPDEVRSPPLNGHAIEVRLYAEDPANDFLPVTGTLRRFWIPETVRVDTGVRDGSVISPYYDPMIAKVIAHGSTREQAARLLADALRRAEIHGLTTNRDFLVRVLEDPEFRDGGVDTGYLERRVPGDLTAPLLGADEVRFAATAAALEGQSARRSAASVLGTLPSGWRNNRSQLQMDRFLAADGAEIEVGYELDRDGTLTELELDRARVEGAVLRRCELGVVELEVSGVRRRYRVARAGPEISVNTDSGQADLREEPPFGDGAESAETGSLVSPMPGRVVRVLTATGQAVAAGHVLLVIEAMKMEHEIVAAVSGMVAEVRVSEGTQVDAGAVLVVIEAEDA